MKKIGLLFTGLLLILIICVYVFIPSSIKMSDYRTSSIPQLSMARALQNYSQWNSQYNKKQQQQELTLTKYKPIENGISLLFKTKSLNVVSYIQSLNLNTDTTLIQWNAEFKTSKNPIMRIKDYFTAVDIKNRMHIALKDFTSWALTTKNIYGFDLERITFTDTLFLVEAFVTNTFPSLQEINERIVSLKTYAQSHNAVAKNYTLQNISIDNHKYTTAIGLCLDKEIPETSVFKIKRMPINRLGTLITNVIGGYNEVSLAHNAIKNYIIDYQLQIKALPFELLLNDRVNNDSTKWQTIINYPCTPIY